MIDEDLSHVFDTTLVYIITYPMMTLSIMKISIVTFPKMTYRIKTSPDMKISRMIIPVITNPIVTSFQNDKVTK